MVATTLAGLEPVLMQEITALGARNAQEQTRAVSFEGDQELLYKANLYLRTALRILKPICHFKANNEAQLYNNVMEHDWSQYLDNHQTFAINSAVHSDHFTHSKFVALKTKDAIVDQFRNRTGQRPSIDVEEPHVRFHLRISQHHCTISIDSSGDPLNRRGYRQGVGKAPLNEVLAAGLIALSGWECNSHFVDPMCGSGTIAIEAALKAYNIAPGSIRKRFGFMNWNDFDRNLWNRLVHEAKLSERTFDYEIVASDQSLLAIGVAGRNIKNIGLDSKIKLVKKAFDQLEPPSDGGLLITNPPYGERLDEGDMNALYKSIGDRLKQVYSGYDAWVLSSNFQAFKHVGLRPSRKIPLVNGALECSFRKYSMYQGSKKAKFNN